MHAQFQYQLMFMTVLKICRVVILILFSSFTVVVSEFETLDLNTIVVPFYKGLDSVTGDPLFAHFQTIVDDENIDQSVNSFCVHMALEDTFCNILRNEAMLRLNHWHAYPFAAERADKKASTINVFHQHRAAGAHTKLNSKHCFVTAFYDIGRTNWDYGFERSTLSYFSYFSKLLQLDLPLIAFVDSRYVDLTAAIINKFNVHNTFVYLVPIDEDFMHRHIRSWSYLETEGAIMQSVLYRERIKTRPVPDTPETMYPRYTCVNHAKVDFMSFVIDQNLVDAEYIGWIDFGYIRENFEILPLKLSPVLYNDKMNFLLIDLLSTEDGDPVHTLSHAPEKIQGGFMFGSRSTVLRFTSMYHETLQYMHSLGVADDDQAVKLVAYFRQPALFKLWRNLNLVEGAQYWGWIVAHLVFNEVTQLKHNVRLFLEANKDDYQHGDL